MHVVVLGTMWSMWNSLLLIHAHEDGNEYIPGMYNDHGMKMIMNGNL